MRFRKFLREVDRIILKHIRDEDFSVSKLAEYLKLSRSQTLRKIKSATGLSANEYIRDFRLKRALQYMNDSELTIAEISYRVGFKNPSYFSKCFHDKFKEAPGEYRSQLLEDDSFPDLKVHVRYGMIAVAVIMTFLLFFIFL